MKIKLKNFQIFRSVEFEFTPGFTLITGPTDNGKTVVFRALLVLLTNSSDAPRYINTQALKEKEDAELVVTITDSDIPKIEFHRNKAKAWYIIDGKKYSKLARNNIFDIYPELNKKFVYDPTGFRKALNFQTENEHGFPFDRSDGEMFKLFERIFNIADTRLIIDTIRKEEDETNFKLSQNQIEKDNLTASINQVNNALGTINADLLQYYKESCIKSTGIMSGCMQKLKTIVSYADFIRNAQNLPKLQKIDHEVQFNKLTKLSSDYWACIKKQEFVDKFIEPELSKFDPDLDKTVLKIGTSYNKVSRLASAIESQNQLIAGLEKRLDENRQRLSEFKTCPLCGHELEGDTCKI